MTTKKKKGRPVGSSPTPDLTERFQVRCTPAQLAHWQEIAAQQGSAVSTLGRIAMVKQFGDA